MNNIVLVISDSHGDIKNFETVLEWTKTFPFKPDAAVFLGDGCRDIARAERSAAVSLDWKFVRGNNDDNFLLPEISSFDFSGRRFLICHGHRHSIYSGFQTILASAHNMEASAALFGHTHIPFCKKTDGILLLNPGSLGRPRSSTGATFAIIEKTKEDDINILFYGFDSAGGITKINIGTAQ